MYLRFVLQFSLIICTVASVRNRCKSDWHYLSDDSICVIFATTSVGDVSWMNSSDACQANSAELLTLSNTTNMQSIKRIFNENESYFNHIQRGTWIGETEGLENDLCDNTSTINDDLQLNCVILTIRSDNQTLCLKKVSCIEYHPFICQTRAITNEEFEETAVERVAFWKCLITLVWCVIDDAKETTDKNKQAAADATAKAIAAAELQSYVNKFATDAPGQMSFDMDQPGEQYPSALAGSRKTNWLLTIGGGCVTLLILFTCIVGGICIFKKMKRSNLENHDGSIDST